MGYRVVKPFRPIGRAMPYLPGEVIEEVPAAWRKYVEPSPPAPLPEGEGGSGVEVSEPSPPAPLPGGEGGSDVEIKHVGGGWYDVAGQRVKGRKAAERVRDES